MKTILHDFKQTPVYAGVVISTEIVFVSVAFCLGMFTQVISYLAAGAAYVAARINGKGESWRYLLALSGSELARLVFNIAKSSPSSINSAYSYDWHGKHRDEVVVEYGKSPSPKKELDGDIFIEEDDNEGLDADPVDALDGETHPHEGQLTAKA